MNKRYKGLLLDLVDMLNDGRLTMKDIKQYLSKKEFQDFTKLYK